MRFAFLLASAAVLGSLVGCPASSPAPEEHGGGEEQAKEGGHEEGGHKEGGHEEGGHEEAGVAVVTLNDTQRANAGVRIETLAPRAVSAVISATAEVQFDPDRLSRVASPSAGRVADVRVVPGSEVQAGGVLAVIDSSDLGRAKGAYLVAQAAFTLAQQNLDRQQALAEAKISAGQALLIAEGRLLQAEAQLEATEEVLRALGVTPAAIKELRPGRHADARFSLRSPIAGIVLTRSASVGAGVEPLQPLFTVGDTSRVWVLVSVLERDLARIRVGQRATVRTGAFPDPIGGEVTYVAPLMDEATRTVSARIEVDNPSGQLRPGMFAQVEIEVDSGGATSLVVPAEAVLRRGGEHFVFVEEKPGEFHRVEVQLGPAIGDLQVIRVGLREGQDVAVGGAFFLESEVEKSGFEAGHAH